MGISHVEEFQITDVKYILWSYFRIWFNEGTFYLGDIYETRSNSSILEQKVIPATVRPVYPLTGILDVSIDASKWDFDVDVNLNQPHFIIPQSNALCVGFGVSDSEVHFIVGDKTGGFIKYKDSIENCINLFGKCKDRTMHKMLSMKLKNSLDKLI